MGEIVEIVKFEDIELMAHQSEQGKVLSTADVAKGYGCKEGAIRSHLSRHADEFIEGKHFTTVAICNSRDNTNLQTQKTYWTPRGVMRLGMFIKSDRAKRFRDWAEDVLLSEVSTGISADSGKRLNDLSIVIERLSRATKHLGLTKSEKIAMMNEITSRELGYQVITVVSTLPTAQSKLLMDAIYSRDLKFFEFLSADDRKAVQHAFNAGLIVQPLLISIYKQYTKNETLSSKAVMSELREHSDIKESCVKNGARYIAI